MSRRIEVTVPNEWADPVRECLADENRCNLSPKTVNEKPHMIVEMTGVVNTVFLVTVPGPAVSGLLVHLRKGGIGTSVGRIVLSSIEYVKPELSKSLAYMDEVEARKGKNKPGLVGFQHFQKARRTTEELYNEISNNASMSINTWLNLVGACVIAAGGLTTNTTVFIVAAMLVSPIMGPILGMTFGYRIADWPLFKTGFINEVKMAVTAFLVGVVWGFILGDVGKTYKWPNSAMMPDGEAFNMVISIVVSAAAGTVLGVSLTAAGGNALVGTAISAGLLPPIVNAGMMISYAMAYAPKGQRAMFFATGYYSVTFYTTHVIVIIFAANFVFWLKVFPRILMIMSAVNADIDPRFREGDDTNFNDIPSLVAHKKRLGDKGLTDDNLALGSERARAEFFFNHIKDDVKDYALEFTDKASNIASLVTGGMIGTRQPRQRRQKDDFLAEEINHEDHDVEAGNKADEVNVVENPMLRSRGIEMTSQGQYASVHGDDIDAAERADVEDQVRQFYQTYNPSKLDQVPEILMKYKGRENELLRKLKKQYSVGSAASPMVTASSSDKI